MKTVFAFLLAAVVAPALAQQTEFAVDQAIVAACFDSAGGAEIDPDCIGRASAACQAGFEQGETTLGISQCNMAESAAWDELLNREYKATRALFEDSPAVRDRLMEAQRAWIALRDADCRLAYDRWEDGSMRNVAGSDCQMRHTARRTLELTLMRKN